MRIRLALLLLFALTSSVVRAAPFREDAIEGLVTGFHQAEQGRNLDRAQVVTRLIQFVTISILDPELSYEEFLETCKRLRERHQYEIPITPLTAPAFDQAMVLAKPARDLLRGGFQFLFEQYARRPYFYDSRVVPGAPLFRPVQPTYEIEITRLLNADLTWVPKDLSRETVKLTEPSPDLRTLLDVIAQTPIGMALVERFTELMRAEKVVLVPLEGFGIFQIDMFNPLEPNLRGSHYDFDFRNQRGHLYLNLKRPLLDNALELVHTMVHAIDDHYRREEVRLRHRVKQYEEVIMRYYRLVSEVSGYPLDDILGVPIILPEEELQTIRADLRELRGLLEKRRLEAERFSYTSQYLFAMQFVARFKEADGLLSPKFHSDHDIIRAHRLNASLLEEVGWQPSSNACVETVLRFGLGETSFPGLLPPESTK